MFEHVKGVSSAVSGYAGGTTKSPTYGDVSTGSTGHAESVQVVFDPAQVSLEQLLEVFFTVAHDPTQRNRQGPDVGTQYRSAVFYSDRGAAAGGAGLCGGADEEEGVFPAHRHRGGAAHRLLSGRVLPSGLPGAGIPYQPYIVINDMPKLDNLRRTFPALYRETPST